MPIIFIWVRFDGNLKLDPEVQKNEMIYDGNWTVALLWYSTGEA